MAMRPQSLLRAQLRHKALHGGESLDRNLVVADPRHARQQLALDLVRGPVVTILLDLRGGFAQEYGSGRIAVPVSPPCPRQHVRKTLAAGDGIAPQQTSLHP